MIQRAVELGERPADLVHLYVIESTLATAFMVVVVDCGFSTPARPACITADRAILNQLLNLSDTVS